MSQKVNPIAFRLGSRRSWLSVWNVKKQGYSITLLNDLNTRFYLAFVLNFFGLFSSEPLLSKSTRRFNAYFKVYRRENLIEFLNKKVLKFSSLKLIFLHRKRKNFFLNILFSEHLCLSVFQSKNFPILQGTLNTQKFKFKHFFHFCNLSAQSLCSMIFSHLNSKRFASNLQTSVFQIIKNCFNKKSVNIIGIKVVCSGRWMKTPTGRSQKTQYIIGKVENQNLSSFVDHASLNMITAFGSCCLNVWLCFKALKPSRF